MNVERFHAIVNALRSELSETEEPKLLEQLATAVNGLAADPAQQAQQTQVSELRGRLNEVLRNASSNSFSPAWREAMAELGVADIFGEPLADRLEHIFANNEITPATAAAEITGIRKHVEALVEGLGSASSGLEFFKIGAEELEPGEFEIGFLIPRRSVNDALEQLGREFVDLQQILGPFGELAGEGRPEIKIRSLASSEFQVFLESTPGAALAVATALDRILAAYEKVQSIRQKRKELAEDDEVPDELLEGLATHATGLMAEEIESIIDELIAEARMGDEGRLNELRQELKLSLNALAKRVDLGYNVEVRAGELPPRPPKTMRRRMRIPWTPPPAR